MQQQFLCSSNQPESCFGHTRNIQELRFYRLHHQNHKLRPLLTLENP